MQGDGVLDPACRLVSAGKITSCCKGVRVVWSQDAGAVSEGLFVQGDGVLESACCLVGVGEVVE